MKQKKKQLSDWDLIAALGSLKDVPPRDPTKIKTGKETFLFEAIKLRGA